MKSVIALLLGSASAMTEVPGTTAEGLYGAGEACVSDQDCERNTHCNYDNVCESDTYACYDDDECRGTEVCDMANYICVPSTPSPTDPPPGCCPGTSFQSQDACLDVDNREMCEKKSKCGEWIETKKGTDSKACTLFSTPAPTMPETGCCGSDSAAKFDMCNGKESRDKCERSSSCHWNEGDDAVCEPPFTTSDPGCCYGNPSTAYSARWMTACTSYASERECLFNVDELANARCHWEGLPDGYDCSQLWPTTTSTPTEPAGCCYGSSYKANDKCLMAMEEQKCLSKDCLWKVTDDASDCEMTTTTSSPDPTTTSSPAGCCRADPSVATASHNEKCQKRTISEAKCDAGTLCEWVVTENGNDGDECQFVTTTTAPGCCGSDIGAKFEMCNVKEDESSCERSSSCHWNAGQDPDGILCLPPKTTVAPGCCYINPNMAYSSKGQKSCVGYGSEKECLFNEGACYWESTEDDVDCEPLWPTTTSSPTTTIEVGCCKGTSFKSNAECNLGESEKMCGRKCEWVSGGVLEDDCAMTTTNTPTTTAEEGCCRGTSYQSNPDCNLGLTEKTCGRKCEWVSGGSLEEDCAITTTTSTPTTTEVGCCKGDSQKATEKCNAKSSSADCDRMSSCNWVEDGVLDEDCAAPSTTADPGCCYGNPSAAYSARWMEACKSFFTENECLMLTDDLSLARCFWEPLGAYEDCEQTWPTTTSTPTEPAGCCYGESYKANSKCVMAMTEQKCKDKSCFWKVTEDAEDCVITTTESPTTTVEAGCCRGTSFLSNEACNAGLTEKTCGRKCEWVSGGTVEEECAMTTTSSPTTTIEAGCCKGTSFLSNAECNLGLTERTCGRKCEWQSGGVLEVDCVVTTTESPTTTTSTPEVGCCRGTSFMSNEGCNSMMSSHSCGRKCEWVVDGELATDCKMTTTSTVGGCCKGESYNSNLACNEKGVDGGEESCSRSGKCTWVVDGDLEDECYMDATTPSPIEPTTTETIAPPGCCYGTSYKANDKCLKPTDEDKCVANGCLWRETEDPTDCVMTTTNTPTTTQWTTTKTVTEEVGCCAGAEKKNTEMCADKLADKCRENEKCDWRAGEEDCSWPTTTSTPWLGEQVQGGSMAQRRNSKRSHQESMLFGGDNAVAQTMSTQVSLSTVLLCVAAAFAVYQLYRWYANSNSKKTQTVSARPNYQSV